MKKSNSSRGSFGFRQFAAWIVFVGYLVMMVLMLATLPKLIELEGLVDQSYLVQYISEKSVPWVLAGVVRLAMLVVASFLVVIRKFPRTALFLFLANWLFDSSTLLLNTSGGELVLDASLTRNLKIWLVLQGYVAYLFIVLSILLLRHMLKLRTAS